MANANDTTEPEIPESGAVFTFGKSKFAENTPSKFWIKRDQIISLSCGDEHTAVVTTSGRLFTFGSNEYGQLGLGHYDNVLRPSCVKCIKPDRVQSVACGKAHTIISTESGRLFAFGSNTEGQLGIGLKDQESCEEPLEIMIQHKGTVLDLSKDPIKKLAAGSMHSVALTHSGNVYVWGSNKEGQLGLGDEAEETSYSAENLCFEKDTIKDISCGYYHTAIVTESGDLYTFGEADGGKLGLGDIVNNNQDTIDEPTKVEIPEKVCMVSCGGDHTVVLSESGNVYVFGQSTNGQLGLGTRTLETSVPLQITSLSEICSGTSNKIIQICCGENHTSVVSSGGQLFTFGDGRHGKLCLDSETLSNHYTPVLSTRFRDYKVLSAHCGGCHTMVVAQPLPPDKKLESIVETEDSAETADASVNIENCHDNEQDTSVSVNGLGSMPVPVIGLHKDINVEARMRHRLASDQKLPPIRGIRFEKNSEDIIDIDRDDRDQTEHNREQSSDQEESEDETESINGEVSREGDDENEDANVDTDLVAEDIDKESKNKNDEQQSEKSSENKPRRFTGFFKKLSSKKSSDTGAKNETIANSNTDPLESDAENNTNDNQATKSEKEQSEEEGKKRVSFFQKIGFKKKSNDTSMVNEDKKDDDNSSNDSSKNKDMVEEEEVESDEDDEEDEESDDEKKSALNSKECKDKITNVTKTQKHVRIMEKESSEIGSPTQGDNNNGTNEKKKPDAKKSKFCNIL